MEVWASIPGYVGHYEVSTLGRVRSVKRGVVRLLRQGRGSNGYLSLSASRDGVIRNVSIHRAVLTAFVGPCPAGAEAAHLDGDRCHNAIGNLSWVSRKENHSHKERHGTVLRGGRHPNAKLSDSDLQDVSRLRAAGWSQSEVGRLFGVTQAAISRIERAQEPGEGGVQQRARGCGISGRGTGSRLMGGRS